MSIEITMSKTAHSSGVLCLRSGFQYGNAAKIFTHPPRPTYLHYKTFLYNIEEKSSKFIKWKVDISWILSCPAAAQLCQRHF